MKRRAKFKVPVTCADCRFWVVRSTEADIPLSVKGGSCHRHAPVIYSPNGDSAWPYVASVCWCGEFQARGLT